MGLYKDKSTEENRKYWELAEKVSKEVAKWPKWKRDIQIGYSYTTGPENVFSNVKPRD